MKEKNKKENKITIQRIREETPRICFRFESSEDAVKSFSACGGSNFLKENLSLIPPNYPNISQREEEQGGGGGWAQAQPAKLHQNRKYICTLNSLNFRTKEQECLPVQQEGKI